MSRFACAAGPVLVAASTAVGSDLSVSDLFADHRVVPRDVPVHLWGRDAAGPFHPAPAAVADVASPRRAGYAAGDVPAAKLFVSPSR